MLVQQFRFSWFRLLFFFLSFCCVWTFNTGWLAVSNHRKGCFFWVTWWRHVNGHVEIRGCFDWNKKLEHLFKFNTVRPFSTKQNKSDLIAFPSVRSQLHLVAIFRVALTGIIIYTYQSADLYRRTCDWVSEQKASANIFPTLS